MLTDSPQPAELKLAVRGRTEADLLLARLLRRDRRKSEQRLAAAGKQDPLKRLTGASALDRAIESTRVLLRNVDDLVTDLRGELPTNGTVNGAGGNGGPRNGEAALAAEPSRAGTGAAP